MDSKTSELFIYLGSQQNAFFFIHTIKNPMTYDPDVVAQVYNCMIHERFIYSKNKLVVVYEFNPLKNTIDCCIIQHVKNKQIKVDKQNLEKQFVRLSNATPAKKQLVFEYVNNVFLTKEFDMELSTQPVKHITLDNVRHYVTKKPFVVHE